MKRDYGDNMNNTNADTDSVLAKKKAGWPFLVGIGLIFLLVAALLAIRTSRKDAAGEERPLWTVETGPLTISITESGRLQHKDEIIVRNETERSLKILSLVPEGTVVTNGTVIIELDGSAMETERDKAALNVERIQSDLKSARERREILRNQMQANIEQAEVNLKLSTFDLKRVTQGVHSNDLEKARSEIALAEENLERAQDDYAWSKKLHEKGFVTLKDLKADELSAKQKELALRTVRNNLELLVRYTHPQEIWNFESVVKQSEMALERAQKTATAELAAQKAGLLHHEASLSDAERELSKIKERLAACTIRAPADGMVIYETTGGRRRHENRDLMEVGATVHPRHRLVRMPTSDKMLAEISIREASKPKLKEGMQTTITVDALPGKTFTGTLTRIAILPDSTQAWLNPDLKVYKCEVELDESDPRMRPGMNCQVDVLVEEHEKAIFVPVQCVLQVDDKPTVYLASDGRQEKRIVETGMDNSVMIHVLAGLEDGDKVLLDPPLNEAGKNGHMSSTHEDASPNGASGDGSSENGG